MTKSRPVSMGRKSAQEEETCGLIPISDLWRERGQLDGDKAMPKRIVAIVQARLGSQRLPGKVLADVNGQPMVAHVVDRVRAMKRVTCVVGAVPAGDEALIHELRERYVDTFMGSESDVLSRYVMGASMHQADIVVRVTGDCPLWAPEAGDEVVDRMLDDPELEYCSNDTRISGWPDGTDVEAFTADMLGRAMAAPNVTDHDREHVTPWIQRNAVRSSTVHRQDDATASLKLSVDTMDDLRRVRAIHAGLPAGDFSFASTVQSATNACQTL